MAKRHQTDVRSEVNSSMWDATWLCDPCWSQVSCYHIHVCVGLFICLSCKQEHWVSVTTLSTVQNFIKKFWNFNVLQAAAILLLNVNIFAISSPNTDRIQTEESVVWIWCNGWLSWGLDRETVCSSFQPLLNHLKPPMQPNIQKLIHMQFCWLHMRQVGKLDTHVAHTSTPWHIFMRTF